MIRLHKIHNFFNQHRFSLCSKHQTKNGFLTLLPVLSESVHKCSTGQLQCRISSSLPQARIFLLEEFEITKNQKPEICLGVIKN